MTSTPLDALLERLVDRANHTSSLPERLLEIEAAAAIRELRGAVRKAEDNCVEVMAQRETLRAGLEVAKKAMLTAKDHIYCGLWIDHAVDCTLGIEPYKCNCGFSDWIKSLAAALAREGPAP